MIACVCGGIGELLLAGLVAFASWLGTVIYNRKRADSVSAKE